MKYGIDSNRRMPLKIQIVSFMKQTAIINKAVKPSAQFKAWTIDCSSDNIELKLFS